MATLAKNHQDPKIRAAATKRLERDQLHGHLGGLRQHALDMRAAGNRGVEIWSDVARRSVDFHTNNPKLTTQQRWDHVMADVASVFNGPSAKAHLDTYDNTIGRLSGSDPHVAEMSRLLSHRGGANAFTGMGIDSTNGADFRGQFNDGTNNQVFHTNFFNLLGYATGGGDPRASNIPNLFHETVDGVRQGGGGSIPDWYASAWGKNFGSAMRDLRDQGKDPRAIPALIGAAFSNHSQDFAKPWGDAGPDFTGAVIAMDRAMQANMHRPLGNGPANDLQRGLVRIFSWFN